MLKIRAQAVVWFGILSPLLIIVVATEPPTDADCVDERPFPDPVNCTSYYQCFDVFRNGTFVLIHLDCPVGGHFDAATESCVFGPCESEDACDHDCEYVGIDCHNYYTCIDFQRKEYHECSEESGLAFNPILKVCDRIENVEGCRPETSEPPTTTESSCGCEYRAHETDCRRYYFCSDSCRRATCEQRECPGGLLWSVDVYQDGSLHQQCALPSKATCASEGSGSAILEFSCYKKSDGIYINEHDCHSYWRCSNGQALLYACPSGFIYNPETKSCDFSARAQKFCSTE